ncbi:MAG TPA: hypothetical protein VFG14_14710 [Chthoniobacteraceae bacterium]|jgi:hypothetical protein|nr:hypothetical protein [Chthoniobacteraceae bacterium]
MDHKLVFESLGQWHDYWAFILLSAPDEFTDYDEELGEMAPVADQRAALLESYETLLSGFEFARRKLKDEAITKIVRELIEMAFEAYREGEGKRGNHTLQEAEGMIWPSYQLPVKYAVEAERRAFGSIIRYKDIRVSPFPYEGNRSDLGASQTELLITAEERCRSDFRDRKDFKYLSWIQRADGAIEQLKVTSRKKLLQQLRELAAAQQIIGAVVCELVISPVSGLIVFTLHEKGRPEVSAIDEISNWTYASLRFHLEDPSIFTD